MQIYDEACSCTTKTLAPSGTLVLLDGVYTPDNAGMLTISGKSGTEAMSITVHAQT